MKIVKRGESLIFFCPGCQEEHGINLSWNFNSNFKNPTIIPSILLRTGHYAKNYKPGNGCWCTYNAEHSDNPASFKCTICHSYISNGQIQFLPDCTHSLAGQTVELPEVK
jgi:hypothetical protein